MKKIAVLYKSETLLKYLSGLCRFDFKLQKRACRAKFLFSRIKIWTLQNTEFHADSKFMYKNCSQKIV